MRTFSSSQKPAQRASLSIASGSSRAAAGNPPKARDLLRLQRLVGNQAAQRLLNGNTSEEMAESSVTGKNRLVSNFSRIPFSPEKKSNIHRIPSIGEPGGRYEEEADRLADQVMRMAEPLRTYDRGQGSQTVSCRGEKARHGPLRMEHIQQPSSGGADAFPIVAPAISSPGRRLDPAARAFMEPRFGRDFSRVRIHTGARASESARAINAVAYTVNQDVVFGAGQFAPGTHSGKRLLAHELAHVEQSFFYPGSQMAIVRRQEGGNEERRRECLREGLRRQSGQEPSQEQLDWQMDANREQERIYGRTVDPCAGLARLAAEPSVGANEVFPYPQGATLRFSELITQSIPRDRVEGLIRLAKLLDIQSSTLDTARRAAAVLYGPDIPRGVNVTVEASTARLFRASGKSPRIPASGDQAEIPPFDFTFSFE